MQKESRKQYKRNQKNTRKRIHISAIIPEEWEKHLKKLQEKKQNTSFLRTVNKCEVERRSSRRTN